ncbi:hypothetical protein B6U98_01930 [Thermoplasmatales archaeon ex4572_165]|nr:MAG: hypothetical protein B6U98_01930 [Thermoplasmatales archaeon ex4572_165]RLF57817.1 MAG: hypothetical protein DRN27_07010 [Thermoplasmata archaeon]
MAVRQKRNRYIAFTIFADESLSFQRYELIKTIQTHCYQKYHTSYKTYGFFLTRFKDNKGIFRCDHTEKERAISFLKSIEAINTHNVSIETLGTSGTMKALIRKHLNGDNLKE